MGGNINLKSIPFINKLYTEKLLDFIETRNIIIKLNETNTKDLNKVISEAIWFESMWLDFKSEKYLKYGNQYKARAKDIKSRL